jgi:hypothetical protein
MDKKLTDMEIVKALECCRTNLITDCKRCNLRLEDGTVRPFCTTTLIGNALDLINRLQAEKERLKKGWKADVILTADAKIEAYKEFAERLKMRAINRYNEFEDYQEFPYANISHIDELLKEMVGDSGETVL